MKIFFNQGSTTKNFNSKGAKPLFFFKVKELTLSIYLNFTLNQLLKANEKSINLKIF